MSLDRYYDYMFDGAKKQWPGKNKHTGPSELGELQVWITSPDSDCDAYPSVTSDESCESLLFLIVIILLSHVVLLRFTFIGFHLLIVACR